MDKTIKILIVVCCILVATLGVTSGMLITTYSSSNSQNQVTNQSLSQNQTAINKITVSKSTKKVKANNTNSKYITTICKRCGKAFTQPRDGPQYTICDECWNSPEVQEEWEKETE